METFAGPSSQTHWGRQGDGLRWSGLMTHLAAFALALSLFQVAGPTPGGTFIDDDGHVLEGGIEAIAAEGITFGCNPPLNDRYCPERVLTRAQMAAMVVRARGSARHLDGCVRRRRWSCPRGCDQSSGCGRDHLRLQPTGQQPLLPRRHGHPGPGGRFPGTCPLDPGVEHESFRRRQRTCAREGHQPNRRSWDNSGLQPPGQQSLLPQRRRHPGPDRRDVDQGSRADPDAPATTCRPCLGHGRRWAGSAYPGPFPAGREPAADRRAGRCRADRPGRQPHRGLLGHLG